MLVFLFLIKVVLSFTKRQLDLLSTTNILIPKEKDEITYIDFERKSPTNNTLCSEISYDDLKCDFDLNCTRTLSTTVECSTTSEMKCAGARKFNKTLTCQYCFQLPPENIFCTYLKDCWSGLEKFRSTCQVKDDTLCLGSRKFHKTQICEFNSGKIWLIALIISIFLGGLGVDRCYLGYWGWSFLKFCTCGGLCVWTLIDTLLIATFVLGPADGSMYWE